jgi:hypothetical protein
MQRNGFIWMHDKYIVRDENEVATQQGSMRFHSVTGGDVEKG